MQPSARASRDGKILAQSGCYGSEAGQRRQNAYDLLFMATRVIPPKTVVLRAIFEYAAQGTRHPTEYCLERVSQRLRMFTTTRGQAFLLESTH